MKPDSGSADVASISCWAALPAGCAPELLVICAGVAHGCAGWLAASSLIGLLEGATATPESCWFGIREGYGGFSDDLHSGPAISTAYRRWLLLHDPLGDLTTSLETLSELP